MARLESSAGCKCNTVAYTAAHNYSNHRVPAGTTAAPLRGATPRHFRNEGGVMKTVPFNRRAFLKSAVASSAAAVSAGLPQSAQAQAKPAVPATPNAGYAYLNPDEAAFIEAVVDHMVPADELSPKGTDIGINTYIDRALAGGWGKGDRLYMQGPWKPGVPSQGYQLPLTPADLYRAGIAAANAYCVKTYSKPFDKMTDVQRQEFLVALAGGKVTF